MASSSTFSLGQIINVSIPEENTKCLGLTLENKKARPCAKYLGKGRKLAARKILELTIAYEDLSGEVVKDEIKNLANCLFSCPHEPLGCRTKHQDQWLGLLEKHRKAQMAAQMAAQRTGQPPDAETTTSLPTTPEGTKISATTEPSIIGDSIPEGQVSYPQLPPLDTEESSTDVPERLEAPAPSSLRSTLDTLPAHHPTPFARRVPTIHEDFSVSLSPNWVLSYMIGLVMQIGQNVLAVMFVRFGSVSTQDQAGRVTKPVTHLQFLLGIKFTTEGLKLTHCIYTLLFFALSRLAFSVLWPLSGYLAGYLVLWAVSGLWTRRSAIDE